MAIIKTPKTLTIGELIAQLEKFDKSLPIWMNVYEDPQETHDLKLITKPEEEFYSKTDKPSFYGQTFPYVMLF
jgi:hypothetical protein